MADSNNNSNQDEPFGTISYLPILFANGYPTSLEKMTAEQLELFIPFLVKCSLNLKIDDEPTEAPAWWPSSLLEYRCPFEKPNCRKNWKEIMKTVVQTCYDYHKQPFLLQYSKNLSENDTANLRYVKDSSSTTALWSRNPAKLLLTFRNELMLYDKKKRRQLWKKDDSQQTGSVEDTEISIDIFLCDYCDATFVSDEAYTDHERKCNNATEQAVENIVISDDDEEDEEDSQNMQEQSDFMAYFFLASSTATELPRRNFNQIERSLSPKKKRRGRTRKVINQNDREKEFSLPFSSPAGIFMAKKTDDKYIANKLDEIEDYCTAKPNSKIPIKTKFRFQQNSSDTQLKRAMRRTRPYYWPRKHLHSQSHQDNFEFLNRYLIQECQPLSIVAAKMSPENIKAYRERLARLKKKRERANCVDLISDSDEDEKTDMKDSELNDAILKVNGQFQTFPIASTSSTAANQSIPKYLNAVPHFTTLLSNNEIRISRRTSVQKKGSTVSIFQTSASNTASSEMQNGRSLKRRNEDELNNHGVKRERSIHEWLNNVNGENFNQISPLINS